MEDSKYCPLCEASEFVSDARAAHHLNLKEPFTVMCCSECEARWLHPTLSEEEYDEVYAGGYFGITQEEGNGELQEVLKDYPNPTEMWDSVQDTRVRSFQAKLQRFTALDDSLKTVLDIGAGTGAFVREAQKNGFEATGLETSVAACKEAEEHFQTKLEQGRLSQFSPNCQFDILHLNHVFEHFVAPHEAVKDLKRLVRPGGYVMIEVPNQFRSGINRLRGSLGLSNQDPRSIHSIHHPFFYTPKTLKQVLERGGFEVVWLKSYFSERWDGGLNKKVLSLVDLVSDALFKAGRDFEIVVRSAS